MDLTPRDEGAGLMAQPPGNADLGYVKMHGAGNDFVMIDGRKLGGLPAERLQRLAALLCDRRRGLGADGIVVLYPAANGATGADFEMRYINASGLPGEMCGNGARCIAAWNARSADTSPSAHASRAQHTSANSARVTAWSC